MLKLSRVMRWIALSFLLGGSASLVFVAMSLLNMALAHGISREVAAAINAPIFYHYSTIAVIAAFVLLIAESMDFATHRSPSKLEKVRYATSMLCAAAVMIFVFGLVPQMQKMSGLFMTRPAMFFLNPDMRERFHRYHETARIVFGASILFALASISIPAFDSVETTRAKS